MARNLFVFPIIQIKMKLKFLILVLLGGIASAFSQKNTSIIGDYSSFLSPSNKIGLKYKDQIIIDTIYYAFFGLDTVNRRIWANQSIRKLTDSLNHDASNKSDFLYQLTNDWELLDLSGRKITDTKFEFPADFINQKAIVYVKNKTCVIDVNGDRLIDFKFEKINRDELNYFYVKVNNKWGILNSQFQNVVAPYFDEITPFIGQYCLAKNIDTLFAVDLKGSFYNLNNLLNSETLLNYVDTNELIKIYKASDMTDFITGYHQVNQLSNTEVKRKIENESMRFFMNNFFQNHSIAFKNDGNGFPLNLLKSEVILENNYLDFGKLMDLYEIELHIVNDSIVSTRTQIDNVLYDVNSLKFETEKLNCNNFFIKNRQMESFALSEICHSTYNLFLIEIFIKEFENNMDLMSSSLSPMDLLKNISKNYVFHNDGMTFYFMEMKQEKKSNLLEINLSITELMMILKKNTPLYNYYRNMMSPDR
jgi:sulfur relay (sulfurtransferase) DsrF/TusC family protein